MAKVYIAPEIKSFISHADEGMRKDIKSQLRTERDNYITGVLAYDKSVSRDNEWGHNGLLSIGFWSTFFMKSSFRHGWKEAQASAFGESSPKGLNPSTKFQMLSLSLGAVPTGLLAAGILVGVNAAGAGVPTAIFAGVVAGAAVLGSILPGAKGYWEKQKLRRQQHLAREKFKHAVDLAVNRKQDVIQSDQISDIAEVNLEQDAMLMKIAASDKEQNQVNKRQDVMLDKIEASDEAQDRVNDRQDVMLAQISASDKAQDQVNDRQDDMIKQLMKEIEALKSGQKVDKSAAAMAR